MKVLATGAAGFVGRHPVLLLLDADHDVVVFVRDTARYDGPPGAEVAEGGIFEPATPDPAMAEVDAAYYLIHSIHAGGDFGACDRPAARNFVDAAGSAGVERLVYLGGLGKDRDQLSAHLRSRREAEHTFASGAPVLTTFWAAIIVGAGSASFEMVRQPTTRLPVMATPQWVETWCQPVAIADVVAYLAGALDHPEMAGETHEIGGPDVLTYQEMFQRVGTQLGHAPRIVPVPVLASRLSSYWVGLVTDVNTGVARPLIEGLKSPVVVGDDRVHDIVAADETPFDAAVERTLREGYEQREKTVELASTTLT